MLSMGFAPVQSLATHLRENIRLVHFPALEERRLNENFSGDSVDEWPCANTSLVCHGTREQRLSRLLLS
jgi:hypothetical protein